MSHPRSHTSPQRLAAAAPLSDDDQQADDEAQLALASQPDLHELCQRWSRWARTRRMYVRPSLPASTLGRLVAKSAVARSEGPDAVASAQLMAFHLAYLAQPIESLDRRVFELYYFWRVRNVKAAAAELGISRQHWYRLVHDFRGRVYQASAEILAINEAAAAALPSVAAARAAAAVDQPG